MWASFMALVGIAVIVSGAIDGGDIRGIALALIMVASISAMTVLIRKHRDISAVAAASVSNFLGSLRRSVSPLGEGAGNCAVGAMGT